MWLDDVILRLDQVFGFACEGTVNIRWNLNGISHSLAAWGVGHDNYPDHRYRPLTLCCCLF